MASPYDQVTFSGGGTRCFWQGGFLEAVRDELLPAPARIAAVSGGALTAAGFVSRTGRAILERMCAAFADTPANVSWHDPSDDRGLTPHQQIYAEVVGDCLAGTPERAVADGPALEILIARPPSGRLDRLSGSLAALAYEAELHAGRGPHFAWAEAMGVTPERVDGRAAARQGRLAELIRAAACIPPVFDPPLWDGKPVIDGGMTDQAPIPEPDAGRTLVLLTRDDYGAIPEVAARDYVMPSREVPADKIDFTDPSKLRDTWEIGVADGRAFLDTLNHKNP